MHTAEHRKRAIKLLVMAWALCLGIAAHGQTASDGCSFAAGNRYAVGASCTFVAFDKPTSFVPNLNPTTCGGGNFDDAFGWFQATATTTNITYDPDDTDNPIMHLYSGTCASLTLLTCANANGNGGNETITYATTIGTNYLVRIQRSGTNSSMDGRLCIWSPPVNDNCSGALNVVANADNICTNQTAGSVLSATASGTAVAPCVGNADDDVWFSFAALGTEHVVSLNSVAGSATSMNFNVFRGTCAGLINIGCGATGTAPSTLLTGLTAGNTYFIRVYTNTGTGGQNTTFNVCVTTPPANDNCGGAIDLPVFDACFMQTFSNASATASGSTPAPVCGGTPSTDVWFRFVAPTSGAVQIFSEAGSLTDGVFQLYSGSCGSLSLVANGCNNDGGTGANDLMPLLDRRCAPLTGGATYYIRYWGSGGSTGTFGLCVYGPEIFNTPLQDCGGGFAVCNSGPINNSSNWTGCSNDLNDDNNGCLNSNERQGTWYYFAAQATGTIGFTLQPTNNMGNPVNVDYDFAVWGPYTTPTCPPTAPPIRCSYALPNGITVPWTTGMAAGNSDFSEGVSGAGVNGFVAPITVAAGDVGKIFVMYLDNFTAGGQSFNLTWALGGGPSQLNCSILPISIISLDANRSNDVIAVEWTAQDAAMNELFVVEHSINGRDFTAIGSLPASGGIGGRSEHRFDHLYPHDGLNFYRLAIISVDGSASHSDVVSVFFRNGSQVLVPQPNPASQDIYIDLADFAQAGTLELRVLDSSGRLVINRFTDPDDERAFMRLPIQGLDAGYYLLGLFDRTGEQISAGRFVKE